jgi:hypothetical protein
VRLRHRYGEVREIRRHRAGVGRQRFVRINAITDHRKICGPSGKVIPRRTVDTHAALRISAVLIDYQPVRLAGRQGDAKPAKRHQGCRGARGWGSSGRISQVGHAAWRSLIDAESGRCIAGPAEVDGEAGQRVVGAINTEPNGQAASVNPKRCLGFAAVGIGPGKVSISQYSGVRYKYTGRGETETHP